MVTHLLLWAICNTLDSFLFLVIWWFIYEMPMTNREISAAMTKYIFSLMIWLFAFEIVVVSVIMRMIQMLCGDGELWWWIVGEHLDGL